MDLRFADPSETEPLIRLINAAFAVENFFKYEDRTNPEEMAGYFAKGRFLVAEENGAISGCIYVELQGERGYLGMLAVDPSAQRSGVGRRLMAAGEEFLREMGCRYADITVVNLRTELFPIYERLGYRAVGEEPFPSEKMPVKIPCHFVRMEKELGHR